MDYDGLWPITVMDLILFDYNQHGNKRKIPMNFPSWGWVVAHDRQLPLRWLARPEHLPRLSLAT